MFQKEHCTRSAPQTTFLPFFGGHNLYRCPMRSRCNARQPAKEQKTLRTARKTLYSVKSQKKTPTILPLPLSNAKADKALSRLMTTGTWTSTTRPPPTSTGLAQPNIPTGKKTSVGLCCFFHCQEGIQWCKGERRRR